MPRWLMILALVLIGLPAHRSDAQTSRQCFSETNQCIEGRFRQYWEQNGGLLVFGFPITAAANEVNRDTGQTYLTQWFERNRFELHTENQAPYDVLLGRLGDGRLRQLGRDWWAFPKASPSAAHLFVETGHAITHDPFRRYWSTHGLEFDGQPGVSFAESLALFGLPLSEPAMETNASGDTVLTQWFERARFEYHPNNPDPYKVLLGLLGTELQRPPTLILLPVADAFVHRNHPDQNFGAERHLEGDGHPYRESYLKFNLSDLPAPVVAATLRLYTTTDPIGSRAPSGGIVIRMNDTNWSEADVTYHTRPSIDGPVLLTLGRVKNGQWNEFDVTGAVTSNGTLSLALTTPHVNGAFYASREVSGFAPQLIVTLAHSAAAGTGVPARTLRTAVAAPTTPPSTMHPTAQRPL